MLEVKHISKTFNANTINEKKVLKDISITLEEGDFVTIIGGNGAGKSTFLNMIAGVYPIDSGKIILDGEDLPVSKPCIYAQDECYNEEGYYRPFPHEGLRH